MSSFAADGGDQRVHEATTWPARIQATARSSRCANSGGIAARQASMQSMQRGAKQQPAGRSAGSGSEPGMAFSRCRSCSKVGTQASRPLV